MIAILLIAIVVFLLVGWTTVETFMLSEDSIYVKARILAETFTNQHETIDITALPDPGALFSRLRTILDRYDDPDMINEIMSKIDKDPGQLARLYIESNK